MYPALMLTRTSNRTSVAFVDVVLDLIYSLVYLIAMGFAGVLTKVWPTGALEVLSMLMPMTHILFVCRSIQEHAVARVGRKTQALEQVAGADETQGTRDVDTTAANRERNDIVRMGERKLPVRNAVKHAVLSLAVVAVMLVVRCRDRYPFKKDLGPCAPCVCDEAMVLQDCSLPAEVGYPRLVMSGHNVTAVAPGVFDQYPSLDHVLLGKPTKFPTSSTQHSRHFWTACSTTQHG